MPEISNKTRETIDFSFKLGFLFSKTISDLQEILILSNSNNFKKVESLLEADFKIRFKTIEYFFQKLLENKSINDDDFKYIKIFTMNSVQILDEIISKIKNHGKLDNAEISSLRLLLKNLTDF